MKVFVHNERMMEEGLHGKEEMELLGTNVTIVYLPWRNPQFVFSEIVPMFESKIFSYAVFKGMISSAGGLTESTLKESLNSIFKYLSKMSELPPAESINQKKRFL